MLIYSIRESEKIDYMLGIGVYRSWLKQEGVEEYEAYTFRPAITLSYVPMSKFYIRLKGSIENYSPSLADISLVDQYIDSLQIQRGNPNLKPYDYYKFSLNSEFQFGKSALSLWGMYMNFPDAIMEETFWEGDKLIRTNRNQKHLHQLMGSLTFKVRLFRDIINLSLTGGGNYFVSEGIRIHISIRIGIIKLRYSQITNNGLYCMNNIVLLIHFGESK